MFFFIQCLNWQKKNTYEKSCCNKIFRTFPQLDSKIKNNPSKIKLAGTKKFDPEIRNDDDVWELDFFSRPVVNQDGKKIWELIIVNKSSSMEHIEVIPNSMVNSRELRKRLQLLIEKSNPKPKTIKFFRSQMYNMINIALSELDIIVKPSRRTYKLFATIEKREEEVYPKMTGYKPFMKEIDPTLNVKKTPERLPDALRGEKFTFVSLNIDQISNIRQFNPLFLDLGPMGLKTNYKSDIPGIIIFSSRAKPLANWLESIELSNIRCDLEDKDLCIECGLDVCYLLAKLVGDNTNDAKNFEKKKAKNSGLHFVAVQNFENSKSIEGLWILKNQET
mmetsp:Transcript_61/g.84  ORF Transcript_61/g.84 Transcript_61/m.84 type:complete len:334 (+) Transcript_61:5842-6843(+)